MQMAAAKRRPFCAFIRGGEHKFTSSTLFDEGGEVVEGGNAANERRKEGRDTRGKQKTVAKEERHERKAAANDSS